MQEFIEGEIVTLEATFTDDEGKLVDPSLPVTVTVRLPDRSQDPDFTDMEVPRLSQGRFGIEYQSDDPGRYYYKFASADKIIEQGHFIVHQDNTKND